MIRIKMNRRIKIRIVAGVALLLASALVWVGCIEVTNYPPTPENLHTGQHRANTEVTAPDSLIVASYNIYLSEDIDLAIADLRGNPQLAGADILLLQEMDPDGADRIARALQMDFVYWPSFKFASTGRLFGNAILSRWPITGQQAVALPHGNPLIGIRRVVVAADVQIANHDLRVVNMHLSTVSVALADRLEQATVALDSLTTQDGPTVVAGDFNTVFKSDRIQMSRLLRKAGFRQMPLPLGPTASSSVLDFTGFDLTLDHVFYRGLIRSSAGVDRTAETSDHYPIWAVFAWPPDSPRP
jgi:endonuclease/exonuclease/phosphatase family metal-dependent hydrolase